jgi:hypothetical protein
MVTAVPEEKLPAVTSLGGTENVTLTPLIAAPAASLTVADTVVLPDDAMVAAPRATTIDVGTWGGAPMVMGALPLIVVVPTVTLARMVAVVFGVTAVNWLVAAPDASVTAEDGVNEPAPALITEKVTLTFCITTELALVTTAVTLEVPPLAMVAAESDTWTVVGVEAPPGVELGGGVGDSTEHPPRKNARLAAIITNVLVFFMKPPPHK